MRIAVADDLHSVKRDLCRPIKLLITSYNRHGKGSQRKSRKQRCRAMENPVPVHFVWYGKEEQWRIKTNINYEIKLFSSNSATLLFYTSSVASVETQKIHLKYKSNCFLHTPLKYCSTHYLPLGRVFSSFTRTFSHDSVQN